MNRYLNLISGELPDFTIHDWLKEKIVTYHSDVSLGMVDSCFIDGELWVKCRWYAVHFKSLHDKKESPSDDLHWNNFGCASFNIKSILSREAKIALGD